MDSEEEDSVCCPPRYIILLCWILGFAALLVVSVIIGLVFSDYTVLEGWDLSPNQTHSFSSPPSITRLCSGLKAKLSSPVPAPSNPALRFMFFNELPPLNVPYPFELNRSFEVDVDDSHYISFELHEGSFGNISTATDSEITFYVFRGENYENWKDFNGDNWLTQQFYNYSNPGIYTLAPVTSSDTYYFVWYDSLDFAANVNVSLDMVRMEYNTTGASASCEGNPSCILNFKFSTTQISVLETFNSAEEDDTLTIETYCEARVDFEVTIWLGSLAVHTALCLLCYCIWRRWKNQRSPSRAAYRSINIKS